MPDVMNAILVHEYGDPSVLQYEEIPRPEPVSGELLVQVHAAGVNPVDAFARQGNFGEFSLPWIPGWDLSGVVESVTETTAFEVGDSVYGLVRFPAPGQTYAEYASVPAVEVVEKPNTIGHTEAAGVPLVSLTAWQALFEKGELEEGERVLIHGGAGGVGHIAIQLAKAKGAQVITTASGYDEDFLRDLGADEFVNYREERFEDVIDEVDLVVDTIGGDTQGRSFEVVTEGGVIASLRGTPSEELADEYGVHGRRVRVQPNAEALAEIGELIDAGDLMPTIGTVLPLSEARAAHEEVEGTHARGKIVLRMNSS
ncbi:NADP-dependent oxidoreductase (plasmid) [Haloferacaceae archaeon DSL9]